MSCTCLSNPRRVSLEEFWTAYPNKEDRKGGGAFWKHHNLDAQADDITAGLKRWLASDRWKRGCIKSPHAFLNQEMRKVTPPAGEPMKGELRLREMTPEMSNKLAIALVAFAVCGYIAWVQIDCALDKHCRLNWCGKMPCGISHDRQKQSE